MDAVVAGSVVVRAQVRPAEGPRALFLCGQTAPPGSVIERLLAEAVRACALRTIQTGEWRRRDFAGEVNRVEALLGEFEVAVGQGYEAWLLMSAAEQRARRGDRLPFLLLLNPVLGSAQHLNGALLGYRAPRSRRVRAAFGLDPDDDGRSALIRRVTYVFGDNDPFSSQSDWSYLRGLGCAVHVVRGWHQRHRRDVEERLREILADYARETAAAIAAEHSARAAVATAACAGRS